MGRLGHDCEHFGKTSDELDWEVGMSWCLENCDGCLDERACVQASKASRVTHEKRSEHDK